MIRLNTKLLFLNIFLLYITQSGLSQIFVNSEPVGEIHNSDTSYFVIDNIDLIGNKKTHPDIIYRELLFAKNDTVSLKQLSAAQKRVLNTGLFTRVRFDIIGEPSISHLLITVFERWYIYPIPLFYLNERSWDKISYGFQLLYYNFLGRDILLNFSAAFGYNPEFKIAYYNPWFFGDMKLFTNFMIFKGDVKAKSLQLDRLTFQRKGIDWLIGKRFGHFTYLGLTLNYIEITAPKETGLTLSPNGKDRLPSVWLSLQFDNRDLQEYPREGFNVKLWGKRTGNSKHIHYYRYGADLRGYLPVTSKITLAGRLATDLSSGTVPLYDRVFFGYNERIRGRFYDTFEGENLMFGGIELRFPILGIRYLNLPPAPGLESYSQELKFGISAGIFYDTGAVWFQNKKLSAADFRSGFGTGLHFHFPYIDVFRVELGLNSAGQTEFIAEVETAF